jgi:hippurate hydrolase
MQIIQDRRALHQIPELGLELPKTMEYVLKSLSGLNCRVLTPVGCSVCAFFDFGADSAIAFRADMDALPIQENSDKPYASTHPGQMHACGHDGHTAILLEFARRLSAKKKLQHNVLLIFQPGEEPVNGARLICETGILEQYRVRAIFGLHLWPMLEKGKIFTRKNELMAKACEVDIEITGRSAHIGKAYEGLDALDAGMQIYTRARALEKALPEDVYRILNFGFFQSGTVRNAISAKTVLQGSLRSYQPQIHDYLQTGLEQIVKEVCEQTGCSAQVQITKGTPAVNNPPQLVDAVSRLLPVQLLPEPSLTAEDFSEYQQRVPGVFFFLGLGDGPALHSVNFDFDESVLVKGADFFEELAEKFV